MNRRITLAGWVGLALLAAIPLWAADDVIRLSARSGSKMRLEGTSSVHDWQVESKLIGGFLEVGKNFPLEPGQEVKPGPVEARVEAFVTVRSLQSLNKDGSHYSDGMDEVMWGKLKMKEQKMIIFQSSEVVLKEAAKSKHAPYVFEAKGRLALAGVTNTISMPVNVLPLGEKKLKITGTTTVKMTAFGIEPPAPKIGLGLIKTGEEVKLIFEWMVGPARPAAAPAAGK